MNKRALPYAAALGIAGLACAVYVPFLGNPLVFDDIALFTGWNFAYYATTPFDLSLRTLPYFSLAVPQVIWGQFPAWQGAHAHRVISLAFHIACALVLFRLTHELLRNVEAGEQYEAAEGRKLNAIVASFTVAAIFAIHPVAVYGAGYLAQRTIVLATLFGLLSIVLFVRGLGRGSHADAVSGAALYALAAFSKEHALMVPLAAAAAAPLVARDTRFAVRHAAIYLMLCLPVAVLVVSRIRAVIGRPYEPGFEVLAAQEGIPTLDIPGGPWIVSAITQMGLFFKYLALWIAPDTSAMSVDVRIEFLEGWSAGWIALKVGAFSFAGIGALMLLRHRGTGGAAGFGLLYCGLLFLVELSSVRFQEPFVLYRSYLWAPGILIAVAALLSRLPWKIVLIVFTGVCPFLLYQAYDRLGTFSSALALWEDAAAKLPSKPVPWGSRTLFNLGREQLHAGQVERALATADRCIAQYPTTAYCPFARAAIHISLEQHDQALPYIDRALSMLPESGIAHHHRGLVLEKLGRVEEARQEYREASRLRYVGGDYRLRLLESTGGPVEIFATKRATKQEVR